MTPYAAHLFEDDNESHKFAVAVTGGLARLQHHRAIGRAGSAIGPLQALATITATGHAEGRGTAAGPMGEAVDTSPAHLTGEDIAAMVVDPRTVLLIANPAWPAPRPPNAIAALKPGGGRQSARRADRRGSLRQLPRRTGKNSISGLATIAGACSVNYLSGLNVAQVILFG